VELFDLIDSIETASDTSVSTDMAAINDMLEKLETISPYARDNASHALLYGFSEYAPARPPFESIRRFVQNVLSAAEKTGDALSEEARRLAEQARSDRLDPDAERVQAATFKVTREFDRLRGILRFKPVYSASSEHSAEPAGRGSPPEHSHYIARCSPDNFVLPLLADHFWQRFGKTSWAIIDEKRNLGLFSEDGKEPVLRQLNPEENMPVNEAVNTDEWESLWKDYHRSINNEERSNPKLQKQFLPRRYWKYLTETIT